MALTLILIAGRTSRQGVTLNEGKLGAEYTTEIGTFILAPEDMTRAGLKPGDRVRVRSAHGTIELPCQPARSGELPAGVAFLPYGDFSSKLMGGDTHGTGMPDSKGIDVEVEGLTERGQP